MTIRVLFVDDEPNVLAGLRRMLRGQRKVWEMHFADGGGEALELLAQETYDVVVSDMRMPGIDGAQLLTRISEEYPNTARIVLSGQSEHEKVLRAVGPAHQFLSKPCDPDVLINAIDRVCGLHSQLKNESLKRLTSQLTSLPSLPGIYQELMEELQTDEASIQRIGDKIGSDIALSAKILQLVNSSFFGLPQHVVSPQHAVSLLGVGVIHPLVLSASVQDHYDCPDIEGFSHEDLREHCIAVAATARRISQVESNDSHVIDNSFIAGLMHDVGKLVLAANLPDEYARAIQLVKNEGFSISEAEQEIFTATHAEVGAHLLELWGLPNPILEAIAFHHRPSASCSREFTPLTAVYAANVLNKALADESGTWDREYIENVGATDRLEKWAELANTEAVA